MSLEYKYAPQVLSDVIINDPLVRNTLRLYTQGHCKKPLLLHGPFGSGKTTIANLLPSAIEGIPETELLITELKAVEFQTISDLKKHFDNSNNFLHLIEQNRFYIIINEMRLSHSAGLAFRDILDDIHEEIQVIITTNYPHSIDAGVLDRCTKLNVPRITAPEWLAKAQYIAQSEGINIDDKTMLNFLTAQLDFNPSIRDLMTELELFIFTTKNNATSSHNTQNIVSQKKPMPTKKTVVKVNQKVGSIQIVNPLAALPKTV
jgi:replication-associated recombination protein RarA